MPNIKEATIKKLNLLQEGSDPEAEHAEADHAICLLLRFLGYNDVVDEYEKIEKWYA